MVALSASAVPVARAAVSCHEHACALLSTTGVGHDYGVGLQVLPNYNVAALPVYGLTQFSARFPAAAAAWPPAIICRLNFSAELVPGAAGKSGRELGRRGS
jgi:hypothetical protein